MNGIELNRICISYHCQPYQAMDYAKMERNEQEGKTLCDHCGGTGNELLSMYRQCPKCNGTGAI